MTIDSVYEIARYDVRKEKEVLLERAQLLSDSGELRCRLDNMPETACSNSDAVAVIRTDPVLSEVRANQVTRITGKFAVLQELPFVLGVPGHRDDFDESLWSEAMREEHTTQEWVVQPGVYRVLYVNGERWSAFPTPEGDRMLPEDWPLIRLTPRWGRLSFCENGGMTSGENESMIGLVTPVAVVCATLMDPGITGDHDFVLWRRGNTAVDDAEMFVEWLLDGGLVPHLSNGDLYLEAMVAQLFVEAGMNNTNGVGVPGSFLCAAARMGWGSGYLDLDSSEWQLELNLAQAVIDAILDVIAEREEPLLCEMVTAARDPASPAAVARREALEEWFEDFSEGWAKYYQSQRRRQ